MAKIEFNEQELVTYVKELIAADENLVIDPEDVGEIVEIFLARLLEAPKETIADLIIDEIYLDAQYDNEDEVDDDEEDKK